ncbi:TetR/AcrR family transcriptional regulator [candidate division WOR-3 bacterium]|uniref:TetR/AcrR family transcriptional regulator n=1 Tax=candidate division WOR-3 bacterium TaxID=2052148 RepID=A0A660SJ48_UNCW3|nr:MAG: TetR/AcrR family transcriptional regulator [candidate division WOR-3 bacterium]
MVSGGSDDTRSSIIGAAQSLFARFGFRKTTVDEIAKAAHRTKSSVYRYFRSKEDIFRTIVEEENQMLRKVIQKVIEAEDDPKAKLRSYVLVRMKILTELSNFYSALRDEYLERYPFIMKIRESYLSDEVQLIKEILNSGIERGVFEIKDVELTAFTIAVALRGLEYPLIKKAGFLENGKGFDSLLDILFYGIVKR